MSFDELSPHLLQQLTKTKLPMRDGAAGRRGMVFGSKAGVQGQDHRPVTVWDRGPWQSYNPLPAHSCPVGIWWGIYTCVGGAAFPVAGRGEER